jgi:hypothetical protein
MLALRPSLLAKPPMLAARPPMPRGRRPSLRAQAHCSPILTFRDEPSWTSVLSLPRRGCRSLHHYPIAQFAERTTEEAGTNTREALKPSPVPFESSRDDSSGEAPMLQRGLHLCLLPALPACAAIHAGQRPPLLAAGHPCPACPSLVALPPCTSHLFRGAEGLVPSTTTRLDLPRSGHGEEAETSARDPGKLPLSFDPLGNFSSGEAPMPLRRAGQENA